MGKVCLRQDTLKIIPNRLETAGYSSLSSWHQFIQKIYHYKTYTLEAMDGDEVTGLLTLTEVRHPLFGDYLTTAPFGSYGGFAFSNKQTRDALLKEAERLRKEGSLDYVNVRFEQGEETPPSGWIPSALYSTYLVKLNPDTDSMMTGFSSNHRNHIRKSTKKGFQVRFGHLELLNDAYESIARSMQELGSPYHSKKYLEEMAKSLGETLEFTVVYNSAGKLAGGGVFIQHGQFVINLHANILRKYRSKYAGEYLYWSVIERYSQAGLKTLDLGRSLVGSGNETFKMKWQPEVKKLSYWYNLAADKKLPTLNQNNPKFRFAIWTWKRLPAFVVRILGPSLIRGLA